QYGIAIDCGRVRSECDRGNEGTAFAVLGANAANESVAVVFGHADIGNDNPGRFLIVSSERLWNRAGCGNDATVGLKENAEKLTRIRIIFYDEDRNSLERRLHT